jgi:hypothetical protein
VKGSSLSGGQTSEQKMALGKPLKQSKKFKAQSSGLSITEKASSTKIMTGSVAVSRLAGQN